MNEAVQECTTCEKQVPLSGFGTLRSGTPMRKCKLCVKAYNRFKYENRAASVPRPPAKGKSLADLVPDLAAEWSPRNSLTAHEVTASSRYEAVWLCVAGHEWSATVNARRNAKRVCPECHRVPSALESKPEIEAWLVNLPDEMQSMSRDIVESFPAGSSQPVTLACPTCSTLVSRPLRRVTFACSACKTAERSLATVLSADMQAEFHPTRNAFTMNELTYNSAKTVWWVCAEGHEWSTVAYQRVNSGTSCPECSSVGPSKREQQLADWLATALPAGVALLRNDYSLLGAHEVDMYVPELGIAVEFNGLYWHTEQKGKGRHYHKRKWEACQAAGVQLIQVWEDDWLTRPDIVKSLLLHKLGLNRSERIFARKTRAETVTKAVAERFLTEHHIQGYASGRHYLSLTHEGEPVAMLVLKQDRDGFLNIIRYATSATVVGGFTKLLAAAERLYRPAGFITFSDNTVSDGGLYERHGFTAEKQLRPDYMYVVNSERVHKFNYRLKRFREDPNLLWEEGLSESQLATLNRIDRIWDAGKVRWVKRLTRRDTPTDASQV